VACNCTAFTKTAGRVEPVEHVTPVTCPNESLSSLTSVTKTLDSRVEWQMVPVRSLIALIVFQLNTEPFTLRDLSASMVAPTIVAPLIVPLLFKETAPLLQLNASEVIVQPPMLPSDEVILPLNTPFTAVKSPLLFTRKLLPMVK
jgi:hypothetical protein